VFEGGKRKLHIESPNQSSLVTSYPAEFAERYRAAGLWGTHTITQEFRKTAVKFADRPALITAETQISYRELDEQSDLIGAGLLDLGLAPGDRVLLQLGNVAETIVSWYALLKAGLIPVSTLPLHRHHEINQIARVTGAKPTWSRPTSPNSTWLTSPVKSLTSNQLLILS
jgi:2,3-dihydroxybenzoate-AMP ligase